MIRHIVLLKIFEDPDLSVTEEELQGITQELKAEIPQVKDASLRTNLHKGGYQFCMDSVFDSTEALHQYLIHPKHQKAAAFLNGVCAQLSVFDYVFE